VRGTIGDLLQLAVAEVKPTTWDQAFSLSDLSWLSKLIPVEVPRTYSISNYSNELLPSTVDLTVSRSDYHISPVLETPGQSTVRHGVSSGYLNPDASLNAGVDFDEHDEMLIGVSRPLNFQLPVSMTVPIAMFAGGSGIAPFRGFWQSRTQSGFGRNILFIGAQSREKLPYEEELRDYVRHGLLEVHTAFSRDKNGLIYDAAAKDLVVRQMEPRYIDTTIIEQGQTVCDLVISKSRGGLGGYLYICGSVSVYETIMSYVTPRGCVPCLSKY
jgi:sulfite reductase alpha subunit-like flavoprotein